VFHTHQPLVHYRYFNCDDSYLSKQQYDILINHWCITILIGKQVAILVELNERFLPTKTPFTQPTNIVFADLITIHLDSDKTMLTAAKSKKWQLSKSHDS